MNILIVYYQSFLIKDLEECLTRMGHSYKCIEANVIVELSDEDFCVLLDRELEIEHYDCVFTFNYSSIISDCMVKYNIPYISFVYDSPMYRLFTKSIYNKCNYCFIFDEQLCEQLINMGASHIYYMPLPVNMVRLERMNEVFKYRDNKDVKELIQLLSSQISFLGSMYNERQGQRKYDNIAMASYTRGYLDAAMNAQIKVYGYNFLPEITKKLNLKELEPTENLLIDLEDVLADGILCKKMANIERTQILKRLSEIYQVKLYTKNPTPELPNVINMGSVDYYDMMPYVFKCSDINLNITLRSIKTGIPLRAMDIMGAGGFLMSNYQADFYRHFVPGEDLVLYESHDDLMDKCNYYLVHDAERRQIAANGYGKVKEFHNFEVRFNEIFDIVFNQKKDV